MVVIQKDKHYTVREFFVLLVELGILKASPMVEKALTSLEKTGAGKSLDIAELSETTLELWVDDIISKLSLSTLNRYVESIQRIYNQALQCGLATNEQLFVRVKKYVDLVCSDGGEKIVQQKVDVIRQMAVLVRLDTEENRVAMDTYLYSFFTAGTTIEEVIALRFEEEKWGSVLPHVARIVEKYKGAIRRYVFPLEQSQRTVKKIKEGLDRDFRTALKKCKFCLEEQTAHDFVVSTWVSAAKACGIPANDICACCPAAVGFPRYKDIRPSDLSEKQMDAIRKKVANSIVDMDCHWYALRFVGDYEKLCTDIAEVTAKSYAKLYYPMNKIHRRIKGKIKTEDRPVIRNVMFLYTMPRVLVTLLNDEIIRASRVNVFVNNPLRKDDYAIIPDAQMKRFSLLVSGGLSIFVEESMAQSEIELGNCVQITEGLFQGYSGRVIKVRVDQDKNVTMLQIKAEAFGKEMAQALGQHLYITIPQDCVSKVVEAGKGAPIGKNS